MKKSERKGPRSFDTAIEYGTVAMVAREKTRTAKAAVRATRLRTPPRQKPTCLLRYCADAV
jgi:hypothetical protein